jgi:epoxyqueuosine reductase
MTISAAAVKAKATELGFLACGITTLDPTPHADVLDRWLAQGYAGNMRYLHRQARKRRNPSLIVEGAGRAVVVLDSYYYQQAIVTGVESTRPRIARYALGTDYHVVTEARLRKLAAFLRQNGAHVARAQADSGPVPERELAQRAGLGWIGKNTMLIRPGSGSWFFLGSVLTDLPLEVDQPFETDRCGSCTRCLDACPTQAFVEPRLLDATRCISYLTIEYKGEIDAGLAARFGGWAFGCDICNEVCPWNERFAAGPAAPEFAPRRALDGAGEDVFDRMGEAEFEERFGDTPLARPGLERMRRNWRVARLSRSAGSAR